MRYIFLLLILAFCACEKDQESMIIVMTDKGKVEGYRNQEQDVTIFKGIPFAAPPVGDLRWQAPQPVPSWEGIKKTVAFGPSPIQNPPKPFYCWSEEFIPQPEPLSEDCLYLNVWTSAREKTEKLPVIVWIYGGGFVMGGANCAIYDGEELAKKGVVFVSMNYRVGPMGFLAHEQLSNAAESGTSGNYGLLDQIAALQWVGKNIANFGGDPDNVTISGQSAGAYSVHALMASPLAKDLFDKAILQSGGLFNGRTINDVTKLEEMGDALMKVAGVSSISELRALPATRIQELSNDPTVGRFGVGVDDYVLPKDFKKVFASGNYSQTPLLAGWVTCDGSFMGEFDQTVEEYKAEADSLFGADAGHFLELFPVRTSAEVKQMKKKLTMLGFGAMSPHLMSGYNPHETYVYEFSRVPPDKPGFPNYGAFHSVEVPYALHTLHTWQRPWETEDRNIEALMVTYWTNFAKTGNPNGANVPQWRPYLKTEGDVLSISETSRMENAYVKTELDFLENHFYGK